MVKANRFHHTFRRGKTMGTGGRGGLEDIVVSTSDICFIDGREGRLVYRGYDVNDLVEHSSFEEVVFLLWHGGLPSKKELDAHTKALNATANRKLPPGIVSLLKALPKKTTPMEVLRTGISALSAYDPHAADNSNEASARKVLRLAAAPETGADGGPETVHPAALGARPGRRRQLQGRDGPQGAPADRADADPGRA